MKEAFISLGESFLYRLGPIRLFDIVRWKSKRIGKVSTQTFSPKTTPSGNLTDHNSISVRDLSQDTTVVIDNHISLSESKSVVHQRSRKYGLSFAGQTIHGFKSFDDSNDGIRPIRIDLRPDALYSIRQHIKRHRP